MEIHPDGTTNCGGTIAAAKPLSTLSESSLTVARDTSLNLDELVFILSPKTRETHDRD